MSDAPDAYEASRADKLRRIAALGIDPWGQRFDGHQPIAAIRELPHEATFLGYQPAENSWTIGWIPGVSTPPPRVRAAGRIVLRRVMGKAQFLHLQDWTGRIQAMIGQKQVGEQGWALSSGLDLRDDPSESRTEMRSVRVR